MGRILFRGGTIYSPVPGANAMLVEDGLVAWVGSDAAAAGLGEPAAVVELDGAWVAPAFVDAHVHVVAAGLALTTLDLSGTRNPAEFLEGLARAAARTPGDGVVWGTGWDESMWSGQAVPTGEELDRAAGGRPVYLSRVDLHSAIGGAALRRAAGLPAGGGPVRGEAHHQLRKAAQHLLTDGQRATAAEAFCVDVAAKGVAMVHECAGPDIGGPAEPAIAARAAASTGVELVTYWGEPGAAGIDRARLLGARPGGDIFIDGSLGSRTAALNAPYVDGEGWGSLLMDAAAIADHLVLATRAGAQAGFHAIGDAGIEAFVDGLELASAEVGISALAAARHRIEHLEMATQRHRDVIARHGIFASMQPAFDARWGGSGMYAGRLGADRAGAMNDLAALAAAGIPLALGSDAPATPVDPWGAVDAAVHPLNPAHALSARAAFTAHTRGGYRAVHRDNSGVLREGADATFAIWEIAGPLLVTVPDDRVSAWSTDPRSGAPGLPDLQNGPRPRCLATVVKGRSIHDVGIMRNYG